MASPDPPETRHRIWVRILVVLASILAFLAIFTSWIDRQALNTNRWVHTSGQLLEDKTISDAVASYAVDQLYANVDVSAVIKQRLPKDVKQFSAPVAAGVRQFATRAAEQAIQSPRVQQAWQDANRIAHTELVSILKGNNEVVSSQSGKVVLNLRPLVLQLADRIGLKKQLNQKLPPDVGQLEVADSKDLDTAQTVTKLIEGFAWIFTFGSVALFGLAAYLARGRRWMVLLAYGLGLVAAGLGAIAVRGALKGLFVDSLANTEAANEPAKHAWDIGTSLLHSIAITVIIYGVLFVLAAFLASPSGYAVGIRRAVAPALRDRRELVWSIFGAGALIGLIVWPPDGFRQLVLTVLLIALAGVGIEALRRKTLVEFPGAQRGDWMQSMRERASRMTSETGRRVGSAFKGLTDDEDRQPEDAKLDRLERLGELKEKGVLTTAEFREEKKKVLSA
ncbi:MAG TPA: SHOCT domain-containing protein [Solirubrobacterales bacterium]|nr:SHOCT domain-containing protein [Solirubrobacterales bacterium]